MELRNLRTFISVCETKSFTKAAQDLHYTQSAITAQIKALEDELGVELFKRNGRSIDITERGQELLKHAYSLTLLEEQSRLIVSSDSFQAGKIRLAVSDSLSSAVMAAILTDFCVNYPQTQLELVWCSADECLKKLRNHEVDLGLSIDLLVRDEDIQTYWIRRSANVNICSTNHRFAGNKNVSAMDFAKEMQLVLHDSTTFHNLIDNMVRMPRFSFSHSQVVGDLETIVSMVEEGFGVAFLPYKAVKEAIDCGRVSMFMIGGYVPVSFLHMFYYKNSYCTPIMDAFIKSARATVDNIQYSIFLPR